MKSNYIFKINRYNNGLGLATILNEKILINYVFFLKKIFAMKDLLIICKLESRNRLLHDPF